MPKPKTVPASIVAWPLPEAEKNTRPVLTSTSLISTLARATCVFVLLKNPLADQMRYGQTLHQVNEGLHFAFIVVCAIVVVQLAFDIGKWILEDYRGRIAKA